MKREHGPFCNYSFDFLRCLKKKSEKCGIATISSVIFSMDGSYFDDGTDSVINKHFKIKNRIT